MGNLLKTEKVGTDTWYFTHKPVIADYRKDNLGVYAADYISRKAASDEGATEGRGFYLYDDSGDLVYVSSTLKGALAFVSQENAKAERAK